MLKSRPRSALLATLLAASAAILFPPAALLAQEGALKMEGFAIQRSAHVADADLPLNGTGLRAVSWAKGFTAALYLAAPASTAEQAVTQPGPKRLQLRMLNEAPADELFKAVKKGIGRNVPAADLPKLDAAMARFETALLSVGKVRKGDLLDLDFDPARGMLFSMNGTLRGAAIPGNDFYAAFLRSFIGERPYDRKLKAGLLGLPVT